MTMETRFPKQTGPQSASNSAASAATPADDPHPKSGASAPPKNLRKMKRTLTPDNLFRTVANFVTSLPVLVRALRSPKTSAALREKVVLGVTSINDCRYCQWGHTHWAMANGVPLEEVNQILGLQIESLEAKNPAEAAAILFAQHYAEQLDQFDPESIENLRKYYSDAQVDEILAYVRAITLANLTGNTVDALLDRIRGKGRPITVFEGVVGAVFAPILLVLVLLVKAGKLIGTDKRRAARHRSPQDVPQDSGSGCTESKAELPQADLEG
jgi:AhpD family alkylhydroperoxidase